MTDTYHWLDVRRIAEELADEHPGVRPYDVNFVDLRAMVEALDGFVAVPGHPVNEQILEAIQGLWHGEVGDVGGDDDEE
jgi:FeS assembly protein IscX